MILGYLGFASVSFVVYVVGCYAGDIIKKEV
jgi:hypothetical protein